ncbi:MAG: glycosyltransferase [Planctomycetes bacterium]|nr:glycosyltransferase [Planctomycetota bacterium]MBI3848456.1 glycosyltransferase [Planctomycetota bacterium]
MNVLFLNNYHYLRGGSERVFFAEMEALRDRGHRVVSFARRHAGDVPSTYAELFPRDLETASVRFSLRSLRTAGEMLYSRESARAVERLLDHEKPDVAHAHNVYGRLTRSVIAALRRRGVPVVLTLHDYKLVCPTYRLVRRGRICEECRGGRFHRAVVSRCHKESIFGSSLVAFESAMNDAFWKDARNVRCFVAPSRFIRDKFVEFGWDRRRIVHIPNLVDVEHIEAHPQPGADFLYAGRLSEEKGVATLVRAFRETSGSRRLRIAGSGPLESSLRELAAGDSRVEFVGHLGGADLAARIAAARAVIVPSEWYENAPLSVLEAFAHGKPVIAARIGGLIEQVADGERGLLFESGDIGALRAALDRVSTMPDARIEEMGGAARRFVEQHHSSAAHVDRLLALYEDVRRG